MKTAILFIAACALSTGASARTVTLDGEYGCGLISTQFKRMDAFKASVQGATEAERKAAGALLVKITNDQCRPVKGKYKVMEQRIVPEGKAIRIEPSKTESLWVFE